MHAATYPTLGIPIKAASLLSERSVSNSTIGSMGCERWVSYIHDTSRFEPSSIWQHKKTGPWSWRANQNSSSRSVPTLPPAPLASDTVHIASLYTYPFPFFSSSLFSSTCEHFVSQASIFCNKHFHFTAQHLVGSHFLLLGEAYKGINIINTDKRGA
jgi:hypothetical protein